MESARTGLRQIMSDLLRRQPAEEAVLLGWPLVCGRDVAARTQAAGFIDGKLSVEVPDTAWRTQLQSFTSRYLAEYQNLLGPVVRGIEFKLKPSAISAQRSAEKQHSAITSQHSAPKRPVGSKQKAETRRKGGTGGN